MPELVIHILKHGQALCGKPGPPSEWPPGHRWLAYYASAAIKQCREKICPDCSPLLSESATPPRPGE